jgi:CMP-N,N'-diacetyllegionaminic acid synthase
VKLVLKGLEYIPVKKKKANKLEGVEMNILAIIPARAGSKGLPGKNIKDLNGKPLIAYTIEEAFKSKYINRVVVSTNDKDIAGISTQLNAEVPFLRPAELSSDHSPTIDTVVYTVNRLKEEDDYFPEYICLLQCTTPLKTACHIDGAIEKLFSSGMDGVVSVCETEAHPYWMQVFKNDRLEFFLEQEKKILRRQDLPPIYRFNGAIWVIKTKVLLEENSLIVKNQTGYIMPIEDSIDIDNMMDFKFAELLIKERAKA